LRSLLLFVLALAVTFGAGRALGAEVLQSLVVAALWVLPAAFLNPAWRRAYALAWSAVYGPFIGMAVYALAFVSCSHCKLAAWTLLPYMPGLIPVELARRAIDLDRPSDTLWFAVSVFAAALVVIALAWHIRTSRRRWWLGTLAAVLAMGTYGAVVVLALIRA
jgi:hypothetical protein